MDVEQMSDKVEPRHGHPFYALPEGTRDTQARMLVARHQDPWSTGNADKRLFLSWSRTVEGARRALADKLDGCPNWQAPSMPRSSQKVVRLDIHALNASGKFNENKIVDLSTKEAFDEYYRAAGTDFPDEAKDAGIDLDKCRVTAANWQEVIYGVKGRWWLPYAEVINEFLDSAEGVAQFDGEGERLGTRINDTTTMPTKMTEAPSREAAAQASKLENGRM